MRRVLLIVALIASRVLALPGPAQPSAALDDIAGLAGSNVLRLRNGENLLDLAGDGTRAMVFVAWRGNFNAHGYNSVAFYIRSRNSPADTRVWQLVPFLGGRPDRDTLRTEQGADCTLTDLRLVRVRPGGPVAVIVASREFGQSFADSAAVQFAVYRLFENREGVPGWPRHYFKFERTISAKRPYCDVNEAFEQELGLGGAGLGRAEGAQ